MIDPKLLSLLEVCETGNFTRAAEHPAHLIFLSQLRIDSHDILDQLFILRCAAPAHAGELYLLCVCTGRQRQDQGKNQQHCKSLFHVQTLHFARFRHQ